LRDFTGSGVREDLDRPSLFWVGELENEDLGIILALTHVAARGAAWWVNRMSEIEVLFCFFVE